ncbi:MAG TPA: hypothetical protein VGL75_07430 [Acidothermaceae bacterium]|jgi:uncharacterized protein (DUF488 family)
MNVYERFIEEVDALTIHANQSAVSVVAELTRAVKRAQLVVDGDLRPVGDSGVAKMCVRCGAGMPDPGDVSRGLVCSACIVREITRPAP